MKELEKKAGKAALWGIIATFMTSGVQFLTLPIFTRILTPRDYGIVSSYTAWFGILSIILTLSVQASISKAAFDYERELYSYMSSVICLMLLSVGLSFIGLLLYNKLVLKNSNNLLFYFMFLSLITIPVNNIFFIAKRFQLKYMFPAVCTILTTICSVIFSFLGIWLLPDEKFIGKIIGGNIFSVVLGIGLLLYIFFRGKCLIQLKYWKYALFYSIPTMFHLLGMRILEQSDRIMIEEFQGAYYVGLYSVPNNLSYILTLLWSSVVAGGLNPWMYRKLDQKEYEEINILTKILILMAFGVTVVLIGTAPLTMKILASPEYYIGIWTVPPILMGTFFWCIYNLYVTLENHHRKPVYTAVGTLAAAGLNIILNYIFIPHFGFIAAAYTSMACYMLLFIFHYFICRRIEKEKIFSEGFFAALSVLVIGLGITLASLYNQGIVRWTILMAFSIIGLAFLKSLINRKGKQVKNK